MAKEKEKTKLELAQEKADAAIEETNKQIEALGEKDSDLFDALTAIQDQFDAIRNIPSKKKLEYENLKQIRLNWKQEAETIDQDYQKAVIKNTGVGAAGAAAGAAVAAMGPTAAMGVATTFGVASTGTAISTLSGAAATNAALAWLGGGALSVGGGGMAAGHALLALAGPVGWAIAGVALVSGGILLVKSASDKKRLEDIYTLISERDVTSYELAIVELNERISRIVDETQILNDAIVEIKSFGLDYDQMTEAQQYELGSYVNLMSASTQLLTNPILGLQPKYTEEMLNDYFKQGYHSVAYSDEQKELIIYLANLLYKIELEEKDLQILRSSLVNNKDFLDSAQLDKDEITLELFNETENALKVRYIVEEGDPWAD